MRVLFGNAASSIVACSHAGTVQGFISRPSRWHACARVAEHASTGSRPHKVHSQKLKGNKWGFVSKNHSDSSRSKRGGTKTAFGESFERVGLDWVGDPSLSEQEVLYAKSLQHFHVLTFHCLATFFIWLLNSMIVCKYCESNRILWNCSGSFYCWNINWVNFRFSF